MKLHFDGSGTGIGYTINNGIDINIAIGEEFKGTTNEAEYMGLIRGLEKLKEIGYIGDVAVYGDSQLVIRQMQGIYKVKAANLVHLYLWAKELAACFSKVKFFWIYREQNTEADSLTHF